MHDTRLNSLSLAELLQPITVKEFFAGYWERKPLHVARGNQSFCAALPSSSDFEFLLSSLTDPLAGWFSLVKERTRPLDSSMLTQEGSLSLPKIFNAHERGYTLLLNQVQRRHRATGILCRNLEIALDQANVALAKHIGANAYLSPPRSQGFSTHYDPHDVFILQLEGRKWWRIYKRLIAFPIIPPAEPIPPKESGTPEQELLLAPGDLLYIPRGFSHDAHTTTESSLHLTLSFETVTWCDLLREILSLDSRFRESLPRGFLDSGFAESRKRKALARRVRALGVSPHVSEAGTRVTSQFFANLEALPNCGFVSVHESAALRGDTWLGLKDGVFGRVDLEPHVAILHLPGASFRADRAMGRAFRFLLETPSFRVRDLPVNVRLSEKLKFLRALVTGGFLARRASPHSGKATKAASKSRCVE